MKEELEFRKKIEGILEKAKQQEGKVSSKEVEQYFEQDNLSGEQLKLVYAYLFSRKIEVKGYQKGKDETELERKLEPEKLEEPEKIGTHAVKIAMTVEEEEYLREYREDLSAIKPEGDEERTVLVQRVLKGDTLAKSRLIELYLPEVLTIALQFRVKDIFLGDMVQEGNVALLLAVDSLEISEDAHEKLCQAIQKGILELIEEQREEKQRDKSMVEKVKRLEAGIKKLTEDSDKKISVEELAFYLEMSEEEIEDVLRLTAEE